MPREFSAGAVVFRIMRGRPYYLLLLYLGGHWDFPRGHIERGEREIETVRREIEEETGIKRLFFLPRFRHKVQWFYQREGKTFFKQVIFYTAKTPERFIRLSKEHKAFKWQPYELALKQLTFKNSKRILAAAHKYIMYHARRLPGKSIKSSQSDSQGPSTDL